MKKSIILLLSICMLYACKKDNPTKKTIDPALKTVTYRFYPNGVKSKLIYESNKNNKAVTVPDISETYSVDDDVKPGQSYTLQISSLNTPVTSYEIDVIYKNKVIASSNVLKYNSDGTETAVHLTGDFAEADFE